MSKKHFIALAEALNRAKPLNGSDSDRMRQWEQDVRAIADACNDMNPRFDFATFYKACGKGDE